MTHQEMSAKGGFNGAAPDRARRYSLLLLGQEGSGTASTGPRPIGRGDLAPVVLVPPDHVLASTGPRPIGRGDVDVLAWQRGGATPASTGPRPIGRGDRRQPLRN